MHSFFDGFSFSALIDGSATSPFGEKCSELITKRFNEMEAQEEGFAAPKYKGENRWCDDWDYMCTTDHLVDKEKENKVTKKEFDVGRRNSVNPV